MKNIIIGFLLGISVLLIAADFDVKVREPKILIPTSGSGWTVLANDNTMWYLWSYQSKWKRLPNIPIGVVEVGQSEP